MNKQEYELLRISIQRNQALKGIYNRVVELRGDYNEGIKEKFFEDNKKFIFNKDKAWRKAALERYLRNDFDIEFGVNEHTRGKLMRDVLKRAVKTMYFNKKF